MSNNNQAFRNVVKPSEYERTRNMIANYRAYLDMYEQMNEEGLRNHEEVERMETLLQERIRAGEEARRALEMLRNNASVLRLTNGLSTVPSTTTAVPPVLPTVVQPAGSSAYIEELPNQDQNRKPSYQGSFSSAAYSASQSSAPQPQGNVFQTSHNLAQVPNTAYNPRIQYVPYNSQMQRNGTTNVQATTSAQPWPASGSVQSVQPRQANQQNRQSQSSTTPTQQSYPQGMQRTAHQANQTQPPTQSAQGSNIAYNPNFNPSYYRDPYKQFPSVHQPSFQYPQGAQHNQIRLTQAQNEVQAPGGQQQVHRSAGPPSQQQGNIPQHPASNASRQTSLRIDPSNASQSSSAYQAVKPSDIVPTARTQSSLDGALGPPAPEAAPTTAVNSTVLPLSSSDPSSSTRHATVSLQVAPESASSRGSISSVQTPASRPSQVSLNPVNQPDGTASSRGITLDVSSNSTTPKSPPTRTPGQADRKNLARDLLRALKRPLPDASSSGPEAKRQAMEATAKPIASLGNATTIPATQATPPISRIFPLPQTKPLSANTLQSSLAAQTNTNTPIPTTAPESQSTSLASSTPLTVLSPSLIQTHFHSVTPGPPLQSYASLSVSDYRAPSQFSIPVTHKPLQSLPSENRTASQPLPPLTTASLVQASSSDHPGTQTIGTHPTPVTEIGPSVSKVIATDVDKPTVEPGLPSPSSYLAGPSQVPLFLPSPSSSPGLETLETDTNLTDDMTGLVVTDMKPQSRYFFSHVLIPPAPAYIKKWKKKQTYREQRVHQGSEMNETISEVPPSSSISTAQSEVLEESNLPMSFANFEEGEREAIHDHCARLRESPCRWLGCEAVLNTPGALLKHMENEHKSEKISAESPWTCQWAGCGYTVISDDEYQQHIEKHAVFPLWCHFQGCGENFRTPRQLIKHLQNDHKSNSVLRASSDPIGRLDYPLKLIPRIPKKLPSYMTEYNAIRPASVPRARHELVMPMVLRRISGNVPAQIQRYNAARPMPETPSRPITPPTNTPYSFIENRSIRYSSCLSTPAKLRNVTDLNSSLITNMIENGLVLWPHANNDDALPEKSASHVETVFGGVEDGNDRDVFGPVVSNASRGEDVDKAGDGNLSEVTKIRRDADQTVDEQNVELMLTQLPTS